MCSPNQLLLLAIATLLYAPYFEATKISPPQHPVVNSKTAATKQSTTPKEVAVTASPSEAAVNDIPANTTSLDRRTLKRRLPRDETDLFRGETDLVAASDLRRFVSTRVNILNLEDVRVVQMADRMRLPDFYSGGPTNFTMSGR